MPSRKKKSSQGAGLHANNQNNQVDPPLDHTKLVAGDFLPSLYDHFEILGIDPKLASKIEDLCPKPFFKPRELLEPLSILFHGTRDKKYFIEHRDFEDFTNLLLQKHLIAIAYDPEAAAKTKLIITPHILKLIFSTFLTKPLDLGVTLGIVGVWLSPDNDNNIGKFRICLPKDALPYLHEMAVNESAKQEWIVNLGNQIRIQLDINDICGPLRLRFAPAKLPYVSQETVTELFDKAIEEAIIKSSNSVSLKDQTLKKKVPHGKKCICEDCHPATKINANDKSATTSKVESNLPTVDVKAKDESSIASKMGSISLAAVVEAKDEIATSSKMDSISPATGSKAENETATTSVTNSSPPDPGTATSSKNGTAPGKTEEHNPVDLKLLEGVLTMVLRLYHYGVSVKYAETFLKLNDNNMMKTAKSIDYDLTSREAALKRTGRVAYCDLKKLAIGEGLRQTHDLDDIITFLEEEDAEVLDFQVAVDLKGVDCSQFQKIRDMKDENGKPVPFEVMADQYVNLRKHAFYRKERARNYQRHRTCKCCRGSEADFESRMKMEDVVLENQMNEADWKKLAFAEMKRNLKRKATPATATTASVAAPVADGATMAASAEIISAKATMRNDPRFRALQEAGYGDILDDCLGLLERLDRLAKFEPMFKSILDEFTNDLNNILEKKVKGEQHKKDFEQAVRVFEILVQKFEAQAFGPIEDLMFVNYAKPGKQTELGKSDKPIKPTKSKKSKKSVKAANKAAMPDNMRPVTEKHEKAVADIVERYLAVGKDCPNRHDN